jgi:hypothetical protein
MELPLMAQESNPPIFGNAGNLEAIDSYWVTFSGDCGCDEIYVMQIDQNGNITVPPKAVLSIAEASANTSALSKNGPAKINLFHWNRDAKLTRTIIDKATLNVNSTKKTKITTKDGGFLQVTQKDKDNFIIGELKTGPLAAFKLSPSFVPKAPGANLDTKISMSNDEASLSSDGLVLVTNRSDLDANTPDQLFVQLLDDKGVPKGEPRLIASFQDIEASDVTGPLQNGQRFVVYVVDSGTTPDDKLLLQKISSTGAKIGSPKLINTPPNREEDNQVVAIDPLGRFILFTIQGDAYGCTSQDILVYQKLNGKGKKSGTLKVLAGCNYSTDDIMNLDILKE